MTKKTYKDCGVDVAAAELVVDRAARLCASTSGDAPWVVSGVGGYAAALDLGTLLKVARMAGGPGNLPTGGPEPTLAPRVSVEPEVALAPTPTPTPAPAPAPAPPGQPLLLLCTDGVGTKTMLAMEANRPQVIGWDAAAMCLNDLAVSLARPVAFMDYYGVGRLDPQVAGEVLAGMARACQEAGCPLVGGETAELPGMLPPGLPQVVGLAAGVVCREEMAGPHRTRCGDTLLALDSSGLHANGFAMVRQVLLHDGGFTLDSRPPELAGQSVGEVLLTPTRLYGPPMERLLAAGVEIRAAAHITGGGLPANLARLLGPGQDALVHRITWPVPPIFTLIGRLSGNTPLELASTFNMGVGMVCAIPGDQVSLARQALSGGGRGCSCWEMGRVVKGTGAVRFSP